MSQFIPDIGNYTSITYFRPVFSSHVQFLELDEVVPDDGSNAPFLEEPSDVQRHLDTGVNLTKGGAVSRTVTVAPARPPRPPPQRPTRRGEGLGVCSCG